MRFCPNSQPFNKIWLNQGINICFSDTVSSSCLLGIALIFGCIQCALYHKYSTLRHLTYTSSLYKFQIACHFLLSVFAVCDLFVNTFMNENGSFLGYKVLATVFNVILWPISLALIVLERRRQFPVSPTRKHGVVLLLVWVLAFAKVNLPFISWSGSDYWWHLRSHTDSVRFGMWLGNYALTFVVMCIGLRSPALDIHTYQPMNADSQAEASQRSTWSGIWSKLKLIWPFVWPKGHFLLQCCVLCSALLLICGRVCNLYVPIYYKKIVDEVPVRFCWDYILIWVALRFLQGGGSGSMGVLKNIRSFIWIKVQQYTTKQTEIKLFAHLHSLSLRWHLSKKTGEVLRVMDRGTSSINNLLNYVIFNILPTIADIIIAIVYFISKFDIYFGLIVFATMALYLVATIIVTEWRTKYRRKMNLLDNARNFKGVDSLINFETVKYYGNADFEVTAYDTAIVDYQVEEFKALATLNVLNSVQNIIITLGLLGGSFLCAWYIHDADKLRNHPVTVGDFVLFCTYVVQLYAPLNFFGTYYRLIQSSFIDMENMFELLEEKQEVVDQPNALPLQVKQGEIEFKDVHFYYEERKPVLQGVSFRVPAGQTYALVGPSGAGKSSIIRLLFRFYDVQKGSILIDGQDISMIQQESLRKAIGIVPQDTVLFNNDIHYNIRYGNPAASDDEVKEAAKAADIHDKIMGFPDGYQTVVGERGLKLSGGEKQRVAIARTLLKNPTFMLLDEATSALDTHTERNILHSFERICEQRTTVVVAHRLSTVMHAHQILVIDNGCIVEQGVHEELLAADGMYTSMWQEQQKRKKEAASSAENSTEDN